MAVWKVHHSPLQSADAPLGGGDFPPGWEPLLTQEQADRYHVLALCLEYTKVVMPEFSFNLNDNLRNDAHCLLGAPSKQEWG